MLTMRCKSKGILDAHELSGERPDMAAATCSSSERYTGDTRYLNFSIRLRLWRWHELQTSFPSDYELDQVGTSMMGHSFTVRITPMAVALKR